MIRRNDWLNPAEHPIESPTALAGLRCQAPAVLFHGKVRTSKTRTGLKRLFALHMANRGMQSAIVRLNNVDMNGSIRKDIRELSKYSLTDSRSPIRSFGGHNFSELYINDGECRLLGLNQDSHILGTQYDVIYLSQLEQIPEDDFQKLLTRLAGKAIQHNGSYFRQVLADANSHEPDWWAYNREAEGKLKIIDFDFHDNPRFFRDGQWTRDGYDYIMSLKRGLTGLNYDRYFQGLRVSAAGAVFALDNCHFIDTLPDLSTYHRYIAIDWGWQAPTVVLWIAWDHTIDDLILYREFRTNNEDSISIGHQINEINQNFGEKIEDYIIDRDEERRSHLLRYCKIRARQVQKFPGSRLAGYNHIHHSLKCTSLGEPGGIRFYRKMLYRSNVDTHAYRGAENLIKEMRTVKFNEKKTDEIIKEDDHGPDALGYFFLTKMRRRKPSTVDTTIGALNR